ncbi:MAG: tetratricopeptide repeat protein [Lysobacterales bacterium]
MRHNQSPKSWLRLFAILTLTAHSTLADYQSGLDAYNRADYETALKDWKEVIATPPGKISQATIAETHYAIGMLYWMGQYVPVDYAEAATWLNKATVLGHAGAQSKLAFLYTRGLGVEQNYDTAFELFSKSAKQGDIDGQYNLGIFYLNGWGIEVNRTTAAQYLAAASAQGDQEAEAALQDLLKTLTNSQ